MYPTLQARPDILKMFDELVEGRQKIFAVCDKLSAAQLNDSVYAGTWSVLKNLSHLAWAEAYMLAWIKKRPNELPQSEFPKEPSLELPALKRAFEEAHASVVTFVKSSPESVLAEKCLYGKNKTEQTVGGVLFHLIEHEIHHRAFITHKLGKLQGK
jgi:uncharacterized damage-inducible protein DinB